MVILDLEQNCFFRLPIPIGRRRQHERPDSSSTLLSNMEPAAFGIPATSVPPHIVPVPWPDIRDQNGRRMQEFVIDYRRRELDSLLHQEIDLFNHLVEQISAKPQSCEGAKILLGKQMHRVHATNWAFAAPHIYTKFIKFCDDLVNMHLDLHTK